MTLTEFKPSVIVLDHQQSEKIEKGEKRKHQQHHDVEDEETSQQHSLCDISKFTKDILRLPSIASSSIKRRRLSYENPSSVTSTVSYTSDDTFYPPTPSASSSSTTTTPKSTKSQRSITTTKTTTKRRGRPPKQYASPPPSPSMYIHLNDTDIKYIEMRNKNNEASRRSRSNRKDRESIIENEKCELEEENLRLGRQERYLSKQCARWRESVLNLAKL